MQGCTNSGSDSLTLPPALNFTTYTMLHSCRFRQINPTGKLKLQSHVSWKDLKYMKANIEQFFLFVFWNLIDNYFQTWHEAKDTFYMIADGGFSESFHKCWQNNQMNFSFSHTVTMSLIQEKFFRSIFGTYYHRRKPSCPSLILILIMLLSLSCTFSPVKKDIFPENSWKRKIKNLQR